MVATKAIPTGGAGDRIRVYAALLPLCVRDEPKDVTITANGTARARGQTISATATVNGPGVTPVQVDNVAGIALNAITIECDSLLRGIPINTPLVFNAGTPQQVSTTTTSAANPGATSLDVVAVPAPIADNSVAAVSLPGETVIPVTALPEDLEIGSQITFNQGNSLEFTAVLTAAAIATANSITVEPVEKSLIAGNQGFILPDTQIQVNQLTGAIAGGTPILFNAGELNESLVFLTEDALAGATLLKFRNLEVDITPGDVAEYVARLRVLGGTGTGRNVNPNREGVQHFEDKGGYEDGAITNGTWEFPWNGTLVDDDLAYLTVEEAVFQSPQNGRECFVWLEKKPAKLGAKASITKGATVVTSFQDTLGSSAILTTGWTFSGQGSPSREKGGITF